jgi:hypothetical protein
MIPSLLQHYPLAKGQKKPATAGKKAAEVSKTGGTSKKQEKSQTRVAQASARASTRIPAGRSARRYIGTVMTGSEATNARCRNRMRNFNRRCYHHPPLNPRWGWISPD